VKYHHVAADVQAVSQDVLNSDTARMPAWLREVSLVSHAVGSSDGAVQTAQRGSGFGTSPFIALAVEQEPMLNVADSVGVIAKLREAVEDALAEGGRV
jgi:hypothetical protein